LDKGQNLPTFDSREETVMHAVATILVREHEILEYMFERHTLESDSPDTVLVAQDDRAGVYDEEDTMYGVETPKLNVTTTSDPDHERDQNLVSGNYCIQVDLGTSHWPEILESNTDGRCFLHK
jgi:hypothetical protein